MGRCSHISTKHPFDGESVWQLGCHLIPTSPNADHPVKQHYRTEMQVHLARQQEHPLVHIEGNKIGRQNASNNNFRQAGMSSPSLAYTACERDPLASLENGRPETLQVIRPLKGGLIPGYRGIWQKHVLLFTCRRRGEVLTPQLGWY